MFSSEDLWRLSNKMRLQRGGLRLRANTRKNKYGRRIRGLDEIDIRILELLQKDARAPLTRMAKAVRLTSPSVHERISKLEREGYIKGYSTILDYKKLGFGITAFVGITLDRTVCCTDEEMISAINGIEDILECHRLAGDEDLLLKVRTTDTHSLEKILGEKIARVKGVSRTRSVVVLSSPIEKTWIDLSNIVVRDL